MMTDEQKHMVREQREGYEIFRQLETAAIRKMTFEDRVAAFDRIQSLAPYLPRKASRADDDEVTQTWIKIRQRYDATHP